MRKITRLQKALMRAVVLALFSSIASAAPRDACAILNRLQFIDTNLEPRQHELIDISRQVEGRNIIEEASGYVGTMVEIRKNLIDYFNRDQANIPTKQDKHLSVAQANELHRFIKEHPIVGLENTRKTYDPDGCFGFCFGRATVAHAEAVFMGIEPRSIFKIWVAGPMSSQRHFNSHFTMNWQYHVAAMFKSAEGPWLVVDPFYAKVLSAKQWMELHQKYAQNNYELLFQVSDPRRFQVDSKDLYRTDLFFHDPNPQFAAINRFHTDYFVDLFRRGGRD